MFLRLVIGFILSRELINVFFLLICLFFIKFFNVFIIIYKWVFFFILFICFKIFFSECLLFVIFVVLIIWYVKVCVINWELIIVIFVLVIDVVLFVVVIVLFILFVIWIERILFLFFFSLLYIFINVFIVGCDVFGNFFDLIIFLINLLGCKLMWFKYVCLFIEIDNGKIWMLYFLIMFCDKFVVEFVIILIFCILYFFFF